MFSDHMLLKGKPIKRDGGQVPTYLETEKHAQRTRRPARKSKEKLENVLS